MSLLGNVVRGKVLHREYKVTLGIESFECVVPASNTQKFEALMNEQNPNSKQQVKNILQECSGKITKE